VFSRLTKASLEALRYRAEDVGRTITKGAIREARARELQRELLNSQKLTEYFEEHEAERVSSGGGGWEGDRRGGGGSGGLRLGPTDKVQDGRAAC